MVIITGVRVCVLLAFSDWRPGMQLESLQCTGQPRQHKSLRPNVSIMSVRNIEFVG